MPQRTSRLLFVAALMAAPAAAEDPETWHELGFTLVETKTTTLAAFGVLRTRDGFSDPYDVRVGGAVTVDLAPRVAVDGGYLFRRVEAPGEPFDDEHRVFASAAFTAMSRPAALRFQTLYERLFSVKGRGDRNRYRAAFDIERPRRGFSPFLFEELLFESIGLTRSRTRVGLRRSLRGKSSVELAYQFESLRGGGAWRPRHAAVVTFNLGFAAVDP